MKKAMSKKTGADRDTDSCNTEKGTTKAVISILKYQNITDILYEIPICPELYFLRL